MTPLQKRILFTIGMSIITMMLFLLAYTGRS